MTCNPKHKIIKITAILACLCFTWQEIAIAGDFIRAAQFRECAATANPIIDRSAETKQVVSLLQQALNLIDVPEAEIILYGSYADGRQEKPGDDLDIGFTPSIELYSNRLGEFFAVIEKYLRERGVLTEINDGLPVTSTLSLKQIIAYKKRGEFFTPQRYVWLITRTSARRIDLNEMISSADATGSVKERLSRLRSDLLERKRELIHQVRSDYSKDDSLLFVGFNALKTTINIIKAIKEKYGVAVPLNTNTARVKTEAEAIEKAWRSFIYRLGGAQITAENDKDFFDEFKQLRKALVEACNRQEEEITREYYRVRDIAIERERRQIAAQVEPVSRVETETPDVIISPRHMTAAHSSPEWHLPFAATIAGVLTSVAVFAAQKYIVLKALPSVTAEQIAPLLVRFSHAYENGMFFIGSWKTPKEAVAHYVDKLTSGLHWESLQHFGVWDKIQGKLTNVTTPVIHSQNSNIVDSIMLATALITLATSIHFLHKGDLIGVIKNTTKKLLSRHKTIQPDTEAELQKRRNTLLEELQSPTTDTINVHQLSESLNALRESMRSINVDTDYLERLREKDETAVEEARLRIGGLPKDETGATASATGEFPLAVNNRIKVVFFDLGNVIFKWDYHPVARELTKYCKFSEQEIYDILLSDGFMTELESGNITPPQYFKKIQNRLKLKEINQHDFFQIFISAEGAHILIPETVTAMKQLKAAGYRIYILSNTNILHRHHILYEHFMNPSSQLYGLIEKPSDYIGSWEHDIRTMKPAPKIFEVALYRANVKPGQTIFIDDRQEYTDAAEKMGITSIQLNQDTDLAAILHKKLTATAPAAGSATVMFDELPLVEPRNVNQKQQALTKDTAGVSL